MSKVTKEQSDAASRLNERQLAFANLILQKDITGMTNDECYTSSGYETESLETAKVNASRLLTNANLQKYLYLMRQTSLEKVGLTLEYLDTKLKSMIDTCISEVVNVTSKELEGVYDAEGNELKYASISNVNLVAFDDISKEGLQLIQEVKDTQNGPSIKTYSKTDLMKMAYQRLGGLVEKKELTGKDGAPIEIDTQWTVEVIDAPSSDT